MTAAASFQHDLISPFAGADVCRQAGLALPDQARRPAFEHDLWDFTDVVGLPVDMSLANRRLDFSAIADPYWRLVAKELVLAMLAPRHPAVATLPRAYRTPLHLRSCIGRLEEAIRFFGWLRRRGISDLAQIGTQDCEAYLAFRRYLTDEDGTVVGEQSPSVRRAAAQVVVDLGGYRELFTATRVPAGLRPWGGASASAVAEMPSGRTQNKTEPVAGEVLQPMLAAALHLVTVLGPHAAELDRQVRQADRVSSVKAEGLRHGATALVEDVRKLLERDYPAAGTALPMLEDHHVANRIAAGWPAGDPLLPVATGVLARQAGHSQLWARQLPALRDTLQDAVASAGVQKTFARNAAEAPAADGRSTLPWTLPLHRSQAVALVGIVRTAAIIVVAAASGMRASELMELRVGCRRPAGEPVPGLQRFRIASKIVKGQPLGGTDDEWVVIEPVYRAIGLAGQLHDNPRDGVPLLGRFDFTVRCTWFRNWVNSPAGQRIGLAPIPGGPANLRMLRRTLALEMAYRPGGVLASKIHLKHVAVATTEGYASRPGGAQAELLAEINKHESDRNLSLVLAEFRNYQQGILPAGPGARSLTEFFASIDASPGAAPAAAPKTQRNDRDILNLLTKRASVLHLGPANYCWFTDPSRALCLKLAGTPAADRPLTGMCDSARCPQATHHQRGCRVTPGLGLSRAAWRRALCVLTWENVVMGRHFKKADSAGQGYLMPPDARQWLPERHLAWALLELAGELDLAGFQARYRADGQGRAAYDPAMMVTLVMYCYCKGIRSSRGIEMATFDDAGARVICGNLHPDHATTARFAGRHERELQGLLASSVAACAREGLVSVDVVAGDGTKVKASASMAANRTGAELDAGIAALEEVIAAEVALWVEQHLAADAADSAGPQDAGPGGPGAGTGPKRTAQTLGRRRQAKDRLDADTAGRAEQAGDKRRARAARLAGRAAGKEEEAARLFAVAAAKADAYVARAAACAPGKKPTGGAPVTPGGNRDVRRVQAVARRLRDKAARAGAAAAAAPAPDLKVNLTDPGSRVMPLKKGGFDQLYNAQAIACKKQVILAIGTHDSPSGTGALHPLLAKASAVLAAAGITSPIKKALRDAGYASDANFTAGCEAELYVALTRESRQTGRSTAGYAPAAMMPSWEQMAARLDTPEGKALYKQRSAIIEPVFAQLFARLGRHLNYRGAKTDLELHLWATSHNLLKAIGARQRATIRAAA